MKTKILPVIVSALFTGYAVNSYAQANKTLSNLTSPTAVNQSLLPGTDGSKNLGSSTKQWKYFYLRDRIYLNGILTMHAHGTDNFFIGQYAGNTSVSSYYNTGVGKYALYRLTSGQSNTATGFDALAYNTNGYSNTAMGVEALFINTTGGYNTAVGSNALTFNNSGSYNTALGHYAMDGTSSGDYNTATGSYSLYQGYAGNYNTAYGAYTLNSNGGGAYNTAIGYGADVDFDAGVLSNSTAIGGNAIVDASNKVRIGNTAVTSIGGQVGWSVFSDGRYKQNIKENIPGLEFINSLRPVSYTVNIKILNEHFDRGKKFASDSIHKIQQAYLDEATDASNRIIYNGFIAQEVEQVAKKLNYDFSGVDKPQTKDGLYGLRYDNFVVPLVKAVQELSAKNDSLQKQNADFEKRIEALEAMMRSQQSTNSSSQLSTVSISDVSLEQNNPNPFNHTTTIHYTLPQKFATAQIVITDNNGKTLKQINVSGTGKGSINVDASILSAGAYNYSLIVDGKLIGTKQMILTR